MAVIVYRDTQTHTDRHVNFTVAFDAPQPDLDASPHWSQVSPTLDAAAVAAVNALNARRGREATQATIVQQAATAAATARGTQVGRSIPGGVASLDSTGKIPASQIPDNAASTVRAVKLDQTIAHRGVNLAGAEFGAYGQAYGSTYRYPPASDWNFIASRGYSLVRMPFMWERLQPTLGQAFNATEQGHLLQAIADAKAAGLKVMLDLHNYAAYNGKYFGDVLAPTLNQFIDVWRRLSDLFKDDPTVIGYGLMNEPKNMPTVGSETGRERWWSWSQSVLTAIRANGDPTCIAVGGYSSSNMGGWFNNSTGNPTPWIKDPLNNFVYEAHHYWDTSNGSYTNTYAQELAATSGFGSGDTVVKSVQGGLKAWIDWLRTNNARGFIGEFGWPRVTGVTDSAGSAQWNNCAEEYMRMVDSVGPLIWTTVWATASQWSAGYNLRYYLNDGDGNLATPAENAAVAEAHPPFRGDLASSYKTRMSPINFSQRWRATNFEAVQITATANLTAGQTFVSLLDIVEPGRLEQVTVYVNTAAASPVAGQCFVALFDPQTGAQIAVSGDIGASLVGTGFRAMDLLAPTRVYRVGERVGAALLWNGTTPPNLGKAGTVAGVAQTLTRRWGLISGAATAMPATVSWGALTASSNAFWMAASGY